MAPLKFKPHGILFQLGSSANKKPKNFKPYPAKCEWSEEKEKRGEGGEKWEEKKRKEKEQREKGKRKETRAKCAEKRRAEKKEKLKQKGAEERGERN